MTWKRYLVLILMACCVSAGTSLALRQPPSARAPEAPHSYGATVPFPAPPDGSTGYPLTSGGGGVTPTWQATGVWASSSTGFGFYGDGSDGAATADGTTRIACLGSAVANVYTAPRDCYFSSLTVNAGVLVNMAGFRLFANTLLTDNGSVNANGANGACAADAATCVAGAGGGGSSTTSTLGYGGAGGASAPSNLTNSLGGPGGSNGSCTGAGGCVSGTARVAGGTVTQPAAAFGSVRQAVFLAAGNIANNNASTLAVLGGAGGGGAAAVGAAGGGGYLFVAAYQLAGSGVLSANGGSGASIVFGVSSSNCYGGGGGGGGVVGLVYRTAALWDGSVVAYGGGGSPGNGGPDGGLLDFYGYPCAQDQGFDGGNGNVFVLQF